MSIEHLIAALAALPEGLPVRVLYDCECASTSVFRVEIRRDEDGDAYIALVGD
jgi:hypothetical protein